MADRSNKLRNLHFYFSRTKENKQLKFYNNGGTSKRVVLFGIDTDENNHMNKCLIFNEYEKDGEIDVGEAVEAE